MEKNPEEMTIEELKSEAKEIQETCKDTKKITSVLVQRAEAIRDELAYKTMFEPRGISRFEAGQAMFFMGM